MSKLDLYLGKIVAQMMALASAGLISLLVIFTFLAELEDIQNDYTLLVISHYVALSIPRMFYETLPFAALIGSLTGLGLLANNSELIVMRSAGISTWQITLATLKPALALAALGLLVGELLLPGFERDARVIRENAMEFEITPRGGFWHREGSSYMHFANVSYDGNLRNISEYTRAENQHLTRTLWAESARYIAEPSNGHEGYWQFENVITSSLDGNKQAEQLSEMRWDTSLTPEILNTEILVEPDKMSILELRRKIDHMQSQGLNTGKFELGFWTKSFQPIASLSLVFIAISFIFGPLRETTMGMRVVSGLVIGIAFKFIQDMLSPASLVFGFPPLIATLLPIVICLAVGAHLLRRAN
jgi:lipopolysaccharide export system permease protein